METIKVILCTDEEILKLRQENQQLLSRLDDLQNQYAQLQGKYIMEVEYSMRLRDECRAQGII